jgi:trans-aconitate methyltransferase
MLDKKEKEFFKGTAQYYSVYRPSLPEEVVIYIKEHFGLNHEGTLLDMGCGTGISTFALAPFFEKIVAFDTDLEMLNEAKKKEPEGFNIKWQHKSDKDITYNEGPYRLAVACRAFNWMNQYPLLQKLNKILEKGGGIALIGDGSFWTGNEVWQRKIKEVIQSFLGETRRAGSGNYYTSKEPYIEMLKKNEFKDIQYKTISINREWSIQSIIGYLYSTSFSSRYLFGDRLKEFEETMKEELFKANKGSEIFTENTEFIIQSGFNK